MSRGVLLSDDLIFISRIQGHAKAAGIDLVSVKRPGDLAERARQCEATGVLIDLHVENLDIATMVAELKSLTPPPFVVGYGSHVDAATLHRARTAGCDLVLPRSAFVERLADDLPHWCGRKSC